MQTLSKTVTVGGEDVQVVRYDHVDLMRYLDELVDEFGEDYLYIEHYSECRNFGRRDDVAPPLYPSGGDFDNWVPWCIAGHVFAKIGLSVLECSNGTVVDSVSRLRTTRPDVEFTSEFVLRLRVAQLVQDNGGTWGLAHSVADGLSGGGIFGADTVRETFTVFS